MTPKKSENISPGETDKQEELWWCRNTLFCIIHKGTAVTSTVKYNKNIV
jgi:hypothetical protein